MYSDANTSIILRILVQINLIIPVPVQIIIYFFFGSGDRYRIEIFSINVFFNELSNDISHFIVTYNFMISTCLMYVDIFCFCKFSRRI